MKIKTLILFLLAAVTSNAQESKPWVAFWDSDTTHIGFKDINGKIMIKPNLLSFTTARRFDKIMAVIEDDNGDYKSYYLTKSGRKIGIDSLFFYDNASDCESEGFIRFKDSKTELVGIFNQDGEIAIPAEYNLLSKVKNGLVVGLKGATKEFWGNHKEIFSWKGGKQYLINTKSEIVIENFDYKKQLNLYSLKIKSEPTNDPIREEFKGVDGRYYSFVDFEKEFNSKLNALISTNFTKDDLLEISFNTIYYWKDQQGWISEDRSDFINRNFEILKDILLQLQDSDSNYMTFIEGLNPYIYEGDAFAKYFNNCGEAEESRYPVVSVVINNIDKKLAQDHISFLKTDSGYRLINISLRSREIE